MEAINFKYEKSDNIINFDEQDLLRDVCQKFANSKSLSINQLLFYIKENNNFDKSFSLIPINLDDNIKTTHLTSKEILVFEEIPFCITFHYPKRDTHSLVAKGTDKIREVFDEYIKEEEVDINEIYILYNAKYKNYDILGEDTVFSFANKLDKENKKIAISIGDSENKAEKIQPTFQNYVPVDISNDNRGFKIYFLYGFKTITIHEEKTNQMKQAFEKFASKAQLSTEQLKQLFFIYESLGETKTYTYDTIGDLTVYNFANQEDKKKKEISLKAKENLSEKELIDDISTPLINNNIIQDNEKEQEDKKLFIIFFSEGKPFPMEVESDQKLIDVFQRYCLQLNKDSKELYFVYNRKKHTCRDVENTKIKEIINEKDKKEKLMHIKVGNFTDEELPLIILANKNKSYYIKKFFIGNFIILVIQYLVILLTTFLLFFYEVNKKVKLEDISIIYKLIPLMIISPLLIIFDYWFKKTQLKIIMIIFYVVFPPFVIFYGFLLAQFIEPKYIIILFY